MTQPGNPPADTEEIVVRFKAVGNAPIMKQNFYKINSTNRFQAVIQFLRKELGWQAGEPLFTYINLAFSPAPDDTVSNLFKMFATDGHLIVNYRYGFDRLKQRRHDTCLFYQVRLLHGVDS
ncbi:Ubiquitin-like protein ATG12 [Leucoagaricus sp. SymC.cos]|nr:Ubiquitin-like protein ATG12 [Leucoagaricus sp. SymC.cos]